MFVDFYKLVWKSRGWFKPAPAFFKQSLSFVIQLGLSQSIAQAISYLNVKTAHKDVYPCYSKSRNFMIVWKARSVVGVWQHAHWQRWYEKAVKSNAAGSYP